MFLFLQGPHGPFFAQLSKQLRQRGHDTLRAGFNRADRFFWPDGDSYIAHRGADCDWPAACAALMERHGVSDLVLYGDTRPRHARALALARDRGIRTHIFEEGYLRPHWITYERQGANGLSPLMDLDLDQIARALPVSTEPPGPEPTPPAHWGDMRQHMFYGAFYHFLVWAGQRGYPLFQSHRDVSVFQEFVFNFKHLMDLPRRALDRARATRRLLGARAAFHLVLLQLPHDESFRRYGPFDDQEQVLTACLDAFGQGAPTGHHLVFKAHPLDDGRFALRKTLARLVKARGLNSRVHVLSGGKLARVLEAAQSVSTVNSTAAHQALWRALPVKVLGQAVYAKPGLTSAQPLADFFADPTPPDPAGYARFRRFMLATSQIRGGYYSARGRALALPGVVDEMLRPRDRYQRLCPTDAAAPQQSVSFSPARARDA